MLICDTHADTLYAMQNPDRALPLHITKKRLTTAPGPWVQAFALFTGLHGLSHDPGLIQRELDVLDQLKADGFHQITKINDALVGVPNVLLTVEGGEVFHGGTERVDHFASLGVRIAAIVWNHENLLAYPAVAGDQRGLTPYGVSVIKRMHALGMAVDVSHLNPAGVADVLALGGAPPIASHSCSHSLCPHPRNVTDDQLRALFAAGGFVGVNFNPPFLDSSGCCGRDRVIDHLAHFCALGGEAQVGFGSDFDGIETHPAGLRHPGDVPALLQRMEERGFGPALVRAIAGQNFADYLKRVTGFATAGPFSLTLHK
ncbi:MAG: dipeptidase [Clostridia bacterium]|nr:dipeptidase [Clostridia bacterium]